MTFFGDNSIMGKSLVLFAHRKPDADSNEVTESAQGIASHGSVPKSADRASLKPVACCTITETNYFQ